ncbi:hypothetical protein GCM10010912_39140 [Paenibacillus albidus]|uniref:Zinc ribbon domain-containing protein n=1 Tax=Paenibacillus albidus TaxID=2041023 RepID=A0A917FL05_9BACL|nr:FxLYD domain-containing protein [Paenibacillus albidus]GGF90140.1 hypothetical protein GCM10010912_39140 [Paenibacillus albidus]
MYCHECGTKNTAGTAICIRCGTKLHLGEEALSEPAGGEIAAGLERRTARGVQTGKTAANLQSGQTGSVFAWVIPLLLLGVVGLGLGLYYKYEAGINRQVLALQQQAEAEALEGRYGAAVELLDTAAGKRPRYQALALDREIAAEAAELQQQLAAAAEGLKTQQLQTSEAAMKAITQAVAGRQEPVFAALQKELATSQVKLAVMKVKSELDKLNTVDALAVKLGAVVNLEGEEAEAVKKQIISKLAGLSYTAAEKLLKLKDFAGALQAVDKGLSYAPEDEQLSAYRKRIQSEKLAFEQAEQERIERAQQQAAEEDLTNRTAAVDVTGIQVILDEYGDLEIRGTVNNKATRPIYSIDVSLGIYNESGSYLGETYASVYPYRLEPGESGEFTVSYYGVYEEAQASVVNVTWYLE